VIQDGFTNVDITTSNLDRYFVRRVIFESIVSVLPQLSGKLLDAGCGKMPYRQFILENSSITSYTGLDIENALEYDSKIKPDVTWNGIKMPFEENIYNCVLATEVLEHCPEPQAFLNEVYRVMKPEGVFFFTVPFLWPLHEVPHDEYRYTPFALKRELTKVGFKHIELQALGGWHASMAQMLGLWVKRAPMPYWIRRLLEWPFLIAIKLLVSKDSVNGFKEGTMITGVKGIAHK